MRQHRIIHLLMAVLTMVLFLPAVAMADYAAKIVSPDEIKMPYSQQFVFDNDISPLEIFNLITSWGLAIDINNGTRVIGVILSEASCPEGQTPSGQATFDGLCIPFVWDWTTGRECDLNQFLELEYGAGTRFRLVYDINNNDQVTGYLARPEDLTTCDVLPKDIPFVLSSAEGVKPLWEEPGVDGPINRFNLTNQFLINDNALLASNIGEMDQYIEPVKPLFVWDKEALPTETVPYVAIGDGTHNHPLDMNNSGMIVGFSDLNQNTMQAVCAFVYDGSTKTTTALPMNNFEDCLSLATAINEAGNIIAGTTMPAGTFSGVENQAVTWRSSEVCTADFSYSGYSYTPGVISPITLSPVPGGIGSCFPIPPEETELTFFLEWRADGEVYWYEDAEGTELIITMTRADDNPNVQEGILDGPWDMEIPSAGLPTIRTVFDENSGGINMSCPVPSWEGPTPLPGYANNPGEYFYLGLDMDNNNRIIGIAGQIITEPDGSKKGGEFTPVLWEPNGATWNAPVNVADLVTTWPAGLSNLTFNFGKLLNENLGGYPVGDAVSLVVLADNLYGVRISDDGNSILAKGDILDDRQASLNGVYRYPDTDPDSNPDGDPNRLTLEFEIEAIREWYYQDPMMLAYDNEARTITAEISGMDMSLTVTDVALGASTVYSFIKESGDENTIIGSWRHTSGTIEYTMNFSDTGTVLIAAVTPSEPLRKFVSVALFGDGGTPFCTEDDDGDIDIMPASVSLDNIVRVPIRIQEAPNEVEGMFFELEFEAEGDATLDFLGFEPDPASHLNSWAYVANQPSAGVVIVVAVDDSNPPNPIPYDTSEVIGYLTFEISEIQSVRFGFLALDNQDLAGWSATGGCLLENAIANGDVNHNGSLDALDANCIFRKVFDYCDETDCGPCDSMLCDVNQDGECTTADALCVMDALALIDDTECAARLIDYWNLD